MTPEQQRLFDALTPLQKEIATNTIKGMKPIDAYRASSGKARTDEARYSAASEILRNPKVCAFLDSVRESQVTDAIAAREEALKALTLLARKASENMALLAATDGDSDGKALAYQIKLKELAIKAFKQIGDWQGWDAAKQFDINHDGNVEVKGLADFYADIEEVKYGSSQA